MSTWNRIARGVLRCIDLRRLRMSCACGGWWPRTRDSIWIASVSVLQRAQTDAGSYDALVEASHRIGERVGMEVVVAKGMA